MARPYTGYIEEKQRRLTGAINELINGPDNGFNMRYALRAIEEYAKCLVDEARMKRRDTLERIIAHDPTDPNLDHIREELEQLLKE